MSQNRKPPAYQEYAAQILANRNFRLMDLSQRGLLWTIRLECWENQKVPANPEDLAKYLGLDSHETRQALTEHVNSFLELKDNDLVCPEIEDYRQHLNDQKKRQSEGGKKGAKSTNSRHKQQSGDSQLSRQVTRESLVKLSTDKQSQNQPLENSNNSIDVNEWINDYDKASNG